MRKNYIKDRAQVAVMYITEYGNTALWSPGESGTFAQANTMLTNRVW